MKRVYTFGRVILSAIFLSLPLGSAKANFNILHAFNGADGDSPQWLLSASDGTLWGVAFLGGAGSPGNGVLYKITSGGVFTVVHVFSDTPDGSQPGRLIQASDGMIYGLTALGGANSAGTVYRIDLAGNYSILHSFNTAIEGRGPGFLMQASDGFFYGTNGIDGVPNPACPNNGAKGTFFRMDSSGNVTPLHTFCQSIDGSTPNSLVRAQDGFFYGTCKRDGPFGLGLGLGTFWKSDSAGNVTVQHVFGPRTANGDQPTAPNGVVQGADGFFYGSANGGGDSSRGALFRTDAVGNVTTIHSFNDYASDGWKPESNFLLAPDGFFYGTAPEGGLPVTDTRRSGVVYRTDMAGNVTVLHTFIHTDGRRPIATPALSRDGRNLFATAVFEGPLNRGVTGSIQLPAPVQLMSAVSRKLHGVAGAMDVNLPLTGVLGVECRSGGGSGDYQLILSFANTLTSVGNASVTSGTGSVTSHMLDSDTHDYVVNLTGVTNAQVVRVSLTNVNDSAGNSSGSVPVSMGVLLGDTNGNGSVTASDIGQTKTLSGQPLTAGNYRTDVNTNGAINASDVGLVKAQSGTQLP